MKFVTALLLVLTLSACGQNGEPTEPVTNNAGDTPPGSSTTASESVPDLPHSDVLQESIVKSIAADWGISKTEARCLLKDHRASQLGRVASDPEVQAVFKQCGVDPAVVK